MSYGIVYVIGNFINDKLYVGQTRKDLMRRWSTHLIRGVRKRKCIQVDYAIKKYGEDNFCMYIIDTADSFEELMEKEKYWIEKLDTLKNGYNNNPGGVYRKEYHQSLQTRLKNSLRMKGKNHFNYGKHLSEDTRLKISKSIKAFQNREGYIHPSTGKPRTDDVKRKVKEHWNKHYVKCPHCGVIMESRSAKRYHFDNCITIKPKEE